MSKIRRYDEIMEAAKANMIAKQDKLTDFNEGSIIHTFLDTMSRLLERAYVAIRQGYNEMLGILPYSIFGFSKKQGLHASGTVIFSREKPLKAASVIPKGTVITGGGLTFATTESGRIEAGDIDSSEIKVVCSIPGMNGNICAKTIESIESTVPSDVVSVRNDNAFTGGSDEETEADFEERFKTYINGLSGTNAYAIRNAALSVNEVRSVSVENHKPPYKDIYNMSIYVDDGSGGASESTIDAVKLAVEGDGTELNQGHVAPGINVRILAPTTVPVNIEMKATVLSIDTSEAEIEIRNVVATHINRKLIAQEVVLSEIITKVMALNYVSDCRIISPAENVSLGISQIARIGTFKLSLMETK